MSIVTDAEVDPPYKAPSRRGHLFLFQSARATIVTASPIFDGARDLKRARLLAMSTSEPWMDKFPHHQLCDRILQLDA